MCIARLVLPVVLLWAATLYSSPARAADKQQSPIKLDQHRQLFVDDYLVAEMKGVKRVLNQPKKHPANPVLRSDQPWEGMTPFVRTVLYDCRQKLFKMWYIAFAPGRRSGCYATSKDGVHWEKPELGLMSFNGSKANNTIPWSFSRGVVYSPQDPDPSKRYKSLSGRSVLCSPDGFHWKTPAGSKIIPGPIASDNVVTFCYDSLNDRYAAFAKVVQRSAGHNRRSVSVSFSKDFLDWTTVEPILIPDARDDALARQRVRKWRDRIQYDDGPQWHLSQFYSMVGFTYEGMYLGLMNVFDISGWPPHLKRRPSAGGEDGPSYIELASSRDLRSWSRAGNRDIFIPLGKANSWEAGWVSPATEPVVVGDEIRIYYSGLMVTHGDNNYLGAEGDHIPKALAESKAMGGIGAIGLATLRLDGWVSVDAGNKEGTLTTKPLVLDGKKLVINVEAPQGAIAVEILDESGTPVPGYRRADCVVFKGDAIRHTVVWGGRSDVSPLAGKPLKLRFHLKNAKLYSFVCK